MTVQELINELSKLDPFLPVYVEHITPINSVTEETIQVGIPSSPLTFVYLDYKCQCNFCKGKKIIEYG